MSKSDGLYYYSESEEGSYSGACASRDEAIRACIADNDLEPGDRVYTGTGEHYDGSEFIPDAAEDIIERMQESAYEQAGEYNDDWPEVTSKQQADLDRRIEETVCAWMDANDLRPKFFLIEEIEEYVVPAEVPA